MYPTISVIICTHNPRHDYLRRALEALKVQSLPCNQWGLLVIDNANQPALHLTLNLSWHPQAKIVREDQLGLTAARLRGFREATTDVLVFVDDDNLLDADYLSHVAEIFRDYAELGAIAGRSHPEFEVSPPAWISEFNTVLALRDFGDKPLITPASFGTITQTHYPNFAPAGIGLAVRRSAFAAYAARMLNNSLKFQLGRTGNQLTSGEDNDIVLTLLVAGWGVGYFPELVLTHLIPARRLRTLYLARLNYAASRSWVQVLSLHGIRLWQQVPQWTVLPRQVRAFFRYQAWRSPVAYIRWCGACGLFAGQSASL